MDYKVGASIGLLVTTLGCGVEEELDPSLRQANVLAQFQEEEYCGVGENFNGQEGNVYQFITTRNFIGVSDIGRIRCGNPGSERLDTLYVNIFLDSIECQDIEKPNNKAKLFMEGYYNSDLQELWIIEALEMVPEIRNIWPIDE